MRHFSGLGTGLLTIAMAGLATTATAATGSPSVQDSFRLGSGAGVLCQVQSSSTDPAIKGMFDRAYAIVCRDAAVAVGHIYALRRAADTPADRLAALRSDKVDCGQATIGNLADVGPVAIAACRLKSADVGYQVYTADKGKTVYVAEGLAGYDSALQLGLRTVVADRIIPGQIAVATNLISDPTAFARVQAGTLDIDVARKEGYRRNNSGSYAEAAEFFDTLLQRASSDGTPSRKLGEYLVNRALQKSNLGAFDEADALFAEAAAIPTADPVQLRLRRNFLALHLLNQRKLNEALAELSRPIAPVGGAGVMVEPNVIDKEIAEEINSGAPLARQLGAVENTILTPQEKAVILDAQALQLRGTVLRLQGDSADAETALRQALASAVAVREGRVASIIRLRAQTMAELSIIEESRGAYGPAEALLRDAVALLATEYPQSAAVNAANARLAAYLGRRGQTDAALALYKTVVATMTANGAATTGFENLLAPYFELLLAQLPTKPELVDDFFLASETLVRPGVADTQAVLARELSGGSDEASRLFRQSLNLTRDIERTRIELARLSGLPDPSAEDRSRILDTQQTLAALESDQVATQAKLGEFPRYRAISTQALTLADLRASLRPDEAYLKMAVVGDTVYLLFASQKEATAFRSPIGASALEAKVTALRNTISREENGEQATSPLDVKIARELYVDLVQPIEGRLAATGHLVFEPDGAMLRLPVNLLVADQASADAYLAKQGKKGVDEFDFTGIKWLGRTEEVSTAVSARGFRDTRLARASAARKQYLGFGSNAPVSKFIQLASTRSVRGSDGIDCNWPLAAWNRPIQPTELTAAQSVIGRDTASVVTGAAFTDTAIKERRDLTDYRIIHFATHGLVAAPRPECPARPALLTSFGGASSDGLLTFQEIYDLRLDADIVILSACDTAGAATVAATREIGVSSGGGAALDGLVRAFVGAGSRSVLASHWPLPDDYRATERLIAGLFDAKPGTTVSAALRSGQTKLMNEPSTSHPYYWAGLAIIGDGEQPMLRAN